jgi:Flp pilus assembly pilin Flp
MDRDGSPIEEMTMLKRLTRGLRALHDDTAGAMSVEKIMIIALIALPIIILLIAFRETLKGWFTNQSDQLKP